LYTQTDGADNDDDCVTAGAPAAAAAGVRPGNGAWKPRAVAD